MSAAQNAWPGLGCAQLLRFVLMLVMTRRAAASHVRVSKLAAARLDTPELPAALPPWGGAARAAGVRLSPGMRR